MADNRRIGVTIITGDAVAYESVAFTNASAVGLTAALVEPTRVHTGANTLPRTTAFITFETGGVNARYRYDGTAPTAGEGHLAADGKEITLMGVRNLNRLRFILVSAGSATVRVTYHGSA
jgi:hypothetical protein